MATLRFSTSVKGYLGNVKEDLSSSTFTLQSTPEYFEKTVASVGTTPELFLDMTTGSFGAFALASVSASADAYVVILGTNVTDNICMLMEANVPLFIHGSSGLLRTYDATGAYTGTAAAVDAKKIYIRAVSGTVTATLRAYY